MKYTGPVYRPPFEADSLLLQVTVGCSHNRCKFCTMYKDVPFQAEKIDQIERDLWEARRDYRNVRRIFLVNGDPFALSAARLKEIAETVNRILPETETIAMYASIRNIADKSDEDLKALRALKINDLNIGLESGLPDVVRNLGKGFTLDEAGIQLRRLNDAGMDFSVNIITGAAGSKKRFENAEASSRIVNEVRPGLIFVATLHLDEGSVQVQELEQGRFAENTLGENIEEELRFLEGLELADTRFFGVHPSNPIPLDGRLPRDKAKMISLLKKGLASISPEILATRSTELVKGREGALRLLN